MFPSSTDKCMYLMAHRNTGSSEGWGIFYDNRPASGYYHNLVWEHYPSGSPELVSFNYAFNLNTWYHIAIAKNGTTMKSFINGTCVGTATVSPISSSTKPLSIGDTANGDSNFFFTGYLDEVRISNGMARWTNNFTVPTAAY